MAEAQFPLLSQSLDGEKEYTDLSIPTFDELQDIYGRKWQKEKEKFQTQIKCNFFALVEREAEGKQELFMLCVPERKEKKYIQAFLDLFQSQYAPHVGDVERLAGKRTRKLFVTMPSNYS